MRTLAAIGLLCLATACTSDAPEDEIGGDAETTTQDDSASGGTIIDDRTALFNEGADVGGRATHTPDAGAVQAALDTLDTHDDLVWARDHTRFLYGIGDPADTLGVLAVFACDQPPLTDTAMAIELLREASGIDGGGDCYGRARIALDGTLLSWRTN